VPIFLTVYWTRWRVRAALMLFSSQRTIIDLTLTDSDDDDKYLAHDEDSDFETLVKASPASASAQKAPLNAVLVRGSPAQVPRAGPASLSPYPNPLPLLRPAIEEFDTPIRKRAHSPEASATQKRARGPGANGAEPHDRDSGVHLSSPPLSRNVPRSEVVSPQPVTKVRSLLSSTLDWTLGAGKDADGPQRPADLRRPVHIRSSTRRAHVRSRR